MPKSKRAAKPRKKYVKPKCLHGKYKTLCRPCGGAACVLTTSPGQSAGSVEDQHFACTTSAGYTVARVAAPLTVSMIGYGTRAGGARAPHFVNTGSIRKFARSVGDPGFAATAGTRTNVNSVELGRVRAVR